MNAVNDHHVLFVYLAKLMTLHLYVYTWIMCARVVGVGLNVPRSGPKFDQTAKRNLYMASVRVLVTASLLTGFLSCLYFREGEAAQCMPDTANPCIARCNGTTFDLSKAFDFP